MEGTTPVPIGADASCTDGSCGTVSRVVVDPVARAVTHLVVEPHHRNTTARLVPIGVVDVTPGGIRIGCTTAEFEALDPVEEKQFVAGTTTYPAYGPEQAIFWPYYAKGGAEGARGEYVTIDAIPLDEVEVRRDEHVHATDGTIGRVKGLVIEPGSRHVTHLLLQEGHPWGHKEVAIPISAVTGVTEGIQLSLTKQQVQDLPPVDIEPPSA